MDINRVIGDNIYSYTYDIMYHKFKNKEITEKEWTDFCQKHLEKLLVAYTDILIKLKNN